MRPRTPSDAGGCGERFESPGTGSPTSEPAAFTIPPAELFSLKREKPRYNSETELDRVPDRTENRKSRWFPTVIPKSIDFFKATKRKVNDFHPFPRNPSTFSRPKKSKSMISSCFPEIHRLSQNWQNAKSMISSCFPEIHRLSQNWQTAKSMISSHFLEIHRLSRNSKTQSR